jgi:hypothetical protein
VLGGGWHGAARGRLVSARQVEILRLLLPELAAGRVKLCPRCCHGLFSTYGGTPSEGQNRARAAGWWPLPPALSRLDNKTSICSPCGGEEAMEDALGGRVSSRDSWGPRFLDEPDNGITTNEGEAQ